jgi:hypothetical protein
MWNQWAPCAHAGRPANTATPALRRLQPIKRRAIHAEGARKLDHGLAGIHPLQRLSTLVSGQLDRATEPHARSPGALTAFASSGTDELSLKLG